MGWWKKSEEAEQQEKKWNAETTRAQENLYTELSKQNATFRRWVWTKRAIDGVFLVTSVSARVVLPRHRYNHRELNTLENIAAVILCVSAVVLLLNWMFVHPFVRRYATRLVCERDGMKSGTAR